MASPSHNGLSWFRKCSRDHDRLDIKTLFTKKTLCVSSKQLSYCVTTLLMAIFGDHDRLDIKTLFTKKTHCVSSKQLSYCVTTLLMAIFGFDPTKVVDQLTRDYLMSCDLDGASIALYVLISFNKQETYFHILSFPDIKIAQVFEIFPREGQGRVFLSR